VLSTATPAGRDLYWAAHRRFGVQLQGVPLLVVGDFALVGSDEIPRRLPGLISSYLGAGGVDWPPLPGLDAAIAASMPPPAPTPLPTPVAPPVSVQPAVAAAVARPPAPAPSPTPAAPAGASPLLVAGGADEEARGVVARVFTDPRGNGLAILVLIGMLSAVTRSVTLLWHPTRSARCNTVQQSERDHDDAPRPRARAGPRGRGRASPVPCL
jgi:hypothetical protein